MILSVRLASTISVALLLVAAVAGLVSAASPATKKLHVTTARLQSAKQEGSIRTTTLTSATVAHEDALFIAENMVIRSEGDVHEITCTGNPVFTDPENRITADKVIGYSTPRRAEFLQHVKMVSTPKKRTGATNESKTRFREPSTLTCDKLSYDYAGKMGHATSNVVIVQRERTVWADEGTYDQNMELVTLKGNVRMKNAGSEEVKEMHDADTVTVSLENDWIDIVAKPGGTVSLDLEVQDEPQKPTKK